MVAASVRSHGRRHCGTRHGVNHADRRADVSLWTLGSMPKRAVPPLKPNPRLSNLVYEGGKRKPYDRIASSAVVQEQPVQERAPHLGTQQRRDRAIPGEREQSTAPPI